MEIPERLKGRPHLPLTDNMMSYDALSLVNMFYQTDLKLEQFKNSQAFRTPAGELILELFEDSTGELIATFVNTATINEVAAVETVTAAPFGDGWLGAPILIHSGLELEFLDAVGSGNTYPTLCDNTLAWKLACLLNEYNAVGHWKASTFSAYSTAGFELVYKGSSTDAPAEFLLGQSDVLAIIRFHHGQNKGMLCLKS